MEMSRLYLLGVTSVGCGLLLIYNFSYVSALNRDFNHVIQYSITFKIALIMY